MATGMWTAAGGAAAQSQNLDVIANNLANSDTPAFKKDIPTFKEYLAVAERPHPSLDIPQGPIREKELYPLDGKDQSHVVMDGTHTSFEQGNLRVTQSQLDIALDGPGFLEVNTPNGTRFTRQGNLKISSNGILVTSEGYPVLANEPTGMAAQFNPSGSKTDAVSKYINLRDQGPHFSINEQGEIFAGGDRLARLSVVEFPDMKKVKKSGGQLFENLDPTNNRQLPLKTQIRQGVLETSNVNPIEEMTNMIKANRLFEQDLKSLKTYGEMMGKEANEIGKL